MSRITTGYLRSSILVYDINLSCFMLQACKALS
jgi:hypothetical protein